jgi:hypothetical protein
MLYGIIVLVIIKDNIPAVSYKTWFKPIVPLAWKEMY